MSILALVVILVMVLWALAFVVSGVVLGVRLLRRTSGANGLVPAPALKRVGIVLLMGVLGVVFATAVLTAALITEHESRIIEDAAVRFEARVGWLYDAGRGRVERLLGFAR